MYMSLREGDTWAPRGCTSNKVLTSLIVSRTGHSYVLGSSCCSMVHGQGEECSCVCLTEIPLCLASTEHE
ncbi:hypothetical protein KIPB_007463 [Kipferlia bialata]|uniref:Uncharacterized protein n=1 Tax=Kipferlia bialata TaxID=797122 RepID=A0A9K3CZA3_9EUKA|nr:hypothetical protein KIPB_007463 [Kipferlia bialata]|eukprot:g7463.t1